VEWSSTSAPLIEARGVHKAFPGVQALADVGLTVHRGEIVGLVGENGAGKSTLLSVLSGTVQPDSGTVSVRGREVRMANYRAAALQGVFRIYQELALVPNLAVYENLFLSHEGRFRRLGVLRRGAMQQRARDLLGRFDHDWIDPARPAGAYDFSTRQILEILKAFALAELLDIEAPVILLDEPTTALTREEAQFLSGLLERVREDAGLVFVSHRLSEVLELSDRISVLKDGHVVDETEPEHTTEAQLHYVMVGRERDEHFYREARQREPGDAPALEVEGLSQAPDFEGVSFSVRRGEIVGIGGVLGSGKSALGRAVFGAGRGGCDGAVRVEGSPVEPLTTRRLANAGVGYVPPERHEDGIILSFPVAWNISLARLAGNGGPAHVLNGERERSEARRYVESMRIKTPGIGTLAGSLSGGNQQKVVLARWLARDARVLILDNPTRGVDAGAKEEIYTLIRDLADRDVGVVLISDDLLELIGLSNRILIMKDGAISAELESPPSGKPEESTLVASMV
jgi:ribose transport system ATP-binding protein